MTEDDRMLRSLAAAADPHLAPGAAERIAGGAWERAAALRASAPRFRVLRRSGVAVAAAVLVAATVLALRGTDEAFAVEGDPVMVQRGDTWVETHSVRLDSVVEVPPGDRVLRWTGGGTLRPRPGSRFHLVQAAGTGPISVDFERGGGDVVGAAFVVTMSDVSVQRDPSAAQLSFSFTLDAKCGGPRVDVGSGRVMVRSLASSDRMTLGAAETATVRPVLWHGERSLRLAKLTNWSPTAQAGIADGRICVVDADLDAHGGLTLVGADAAKSFLAFQVPRAQIGEAIADVNRFAGLRINVDVRAHRVEPVRYLYERNGSSVEVLVNENGGVSVKTDRGLRLFPDVAAFRREKPELAALFGDSLK